MSGTCSSSKVKDYLKDLPIHNQANFTKKSRSSNANSSIPADAEYNSTAAAMLKQHRRTDVPPLSGNGFDDSHSLSGARPFSGNSQSDVQHFVGFFESNTPSIPYIIAGEMGGHFKLTQGGHSNEEKCLWVFKHYSGSKNFTELP